MQHFALEANTAVKRRADSARSALDSPNQVAKTARDGCPHVGRSSQTNEESTKDRRDVVHLTRALNQLDDVRTPCGAGTRSNATRWQHHFEHVHKQKRKAPTRSAPSFFHTT